MNAAGTGDTIAIDEVFFNVENVVIPPNSTLTLRPTIGTSNCKVPAHPVGGRFFLEAAPGSFPAVTVSQGSVVTIHGGTITGPPSPWSASAVQTLDDVNLTILNSDVEGMTAPLGAAIRHGEDGQLTIDGSRVFGGNSLGDGGNVYVGVGSTLDVTDSVIELGTADGDGGGVFVEGGLPLALNVTVTDSFIRNNSANNGGGLAVMNALLTATDSVIENNHAASGGLVFGSGGGLYHAIGSVTLIGRTRVRNNSASLGGGIFMEPAVTILDMSQESAIHQTPEIRLNSASQGGGVFMDVATVPNSMVGGWVRQNSTSSTFGGTGGGVQIEGSLNAGFVMSGTRIWDNTTDGDGGGIASADVGLTLDDVEILRNDADRGGGVFARQPGFLRIERARISNNDAESDGGGVYVDGSDNGTILVESDADGCNSSGFPAGSFCTELDNNEAVRGGAFFIDEADAMINRVAMRGNTTTGDGETIAAVDSVLELENVLIEQSDVGSGAGDVHLDDTDAFLNGVTIASTQRSANPLIFLDHGLPFDANSTSELTIRASIVATGGDVDMGGMSKIATECNLLHSVAAGTVLTGGPNLIGPSFTPDFVAPASGDYHLGANSDALNQCKTGLTEDLDGDPRVPFHDMGALERP